MGINVFFVCASYLVHLPVGAISHQLNQLKDASRILEKQRKHGGISGMNYHTLNRIKH